VAENSLLLSKDSPFFGLKDSDRDSQSSQFKLLSLSLKKQSHTLKPLLTTFFVPRLPLFSTRALLDFLRIMRYAIKRVVREPQPPQPPQAASVARACLADE